MFQSNTMEAEIKNLQKP